MNDSATVPFLDVGATYRELRPEIDEAVRRVLASGWYVLGHEVETFENDFGGSIGATECVGVGSGLDALRLSLLAMDVGPGDEVIVPANTYIASWLAVTQVGATVVPVEPDERTYTIDPEACSAAITSRTRVIMPVHLYGAPADVSRIRAIASKHGVRVLEDAAQAHGASHRGAVVGSNADVVAWSFYPTKNLGAFGDGGAVTSDDTDFAVRVRRLANYGSSRRFVNDEIGYNSRLDPIQAAILSVKLKYLREWNLRRRSVAHRYLDELAHTSLLMPKRLEDSESAWHLFVVRTPRRDALEDHLREAGIQSMVHYPTPPHLQNAYANLGMGPGSFPISERIHDEVLSLPMGPHLSEVHQARVIEAIGEWDGDEP